MIRLTWSRTVIEPDMADESPQCDESTKRDISKAKFSEHHNNSDSVSVTFRFSCMDK